jgi:down-regulator of transcription 1
MAKPQDLDEEQVSLPRGTSRTSLLTPATVVKMVQEFLPDGITCGRDTQDLIVSCCHEFIQMLTFQANQICQRGTQSGFLGLPHVLKACEELGFPEYIREIQHVADVHGRQVKAIQKVFSWRVALTFVEKG